MRDPAMYLGSGSWIRNLDKEGSDKDYKLSVLPTLKDLVQGNRHKDRTSSPEKDV